MTDNEIIKALECCAEDEWRCNNNCPFFEKCSKTLMAKSSLDIITRQQAEIEKLKGYPYAIQVEVSKKLESQIKSKAAKECLAKVKNYIKTHCNPYGKPDFEYDTSIKILNFIDNLVKEMVGDKE